MRKLEELSLINQGSAESALVLDGYRSDPSSRFGLTVRISDPSAKAKRTDEKDIVLFVGGLGSKTTEQDVKDLFKEVSIEQTTD
jgi:RNA recognition motif-containing protein